MENKREFYERRVEELKQKSTYENTPIIIAVQNTNKIKSLKEIGLVNFNGIWMNLGVTGGNDGTKFKDDVYEHLESDIEKMRKRFRMYISFSADAAAHSIALEALTNALDECKNPRSPGNKIHIEFDERDGFMTISDNGRGIPTDIIEAVFTSLNYGSNIDTSEKAKLKIDNLGQNGVGFDKMYYMRYPNETSWT